AFGKGRAYDAGASSRRSPRARQAGPRTQGFAVGARRRRRPGRQHRHGRGRDRAPHCHARARTRKGTGHRRREEAVMIRLLITLAIAIASATLASPLMVYGAAKNSEGPDASAQSAASQKLRAFLEADWQRWMQEYPEIATHVGYPDLDDRWTDDSPAGIERH